MASRNNRLGPPAIILAGGTGTRLRNIIPDQPKPMIPVHGRPFLDYVVNYLRHQGVAEIIVSIGHRADQIESHFESSHDSPEGVRLIRETSPLGTGGAVEHVLSQVALPGWFLVVNGDSLARFDLASLIEASAGADAAIVGVYSPDTRRFGRLEFDAQQLLIGFEEKITGEPAPGFINAGIYLLTRVLVESAPVSIGGRIVSLEKDYFPRWLSDKKRIRVVLSKGPFIDIGTPESLAQAPEFIQTFWSTFSP